MELWRRQLRQCSHGGRSPSAIFFPKFHGISTGSHTDDQNLIKSRGASAENPTGGEEPFAVWQAGICAAVTEIPMVCYRATELSWEVLKLQPHASLHSSAHAASPVPKPASLKVPWVPLCCRYFPAPEDFDWESFFQQSHPVWWFQRWRIKTFPF